MLFLLYINDLPQVVPHPIQSGMFADDVALWSSIFTTDMDEMKQQLNLMQQSVDNISIWGNKWKMLLAADKTQCITFRRRTKTSFQICHIAWL